MEFVDLIDDILTAIVLLGCSVALVVLLVEWWNRRGQ